MRASQLKAQTSDVPIRRHRCPSDLRLPIFCLQSAPCSMQPSYCWKLIAEGLGQRRVSVVVLGVIPLPRKVQHSPSVEQQQISTVTRPRSLFSFTQSGFDLSKLSGLFSASCGVKTVIDS